ncbi:MAG: hypothetical protein U0Y10_04120 [Spirosomataceae bacterium]
MKRISILLLMVAWYQTQAQTIEEAQFKGGNKNFFHYCLAYFNKRINQNFDTTCIKTCIIVRFRIDEKGRVKDARANPTVPKLMARTFELMVEESSGLWEPQKVNGVPVMSGEFLQIFIHTFKKNCIPQNPDDTGVKDMIASTLWTLLWQDFETLQKTRAIELIDKSPVDHLNCTILHPIMFYGTVNGN